MIRLGSISLFALVLFTVAWLAPEILFRAVQGVAAHQISGLQALYYLILQIPGVLAYCIPIAALFASVFLFRQLSLSSELVAIQASGISFQRLQVPVAIVGLGLMTLFILNQECFEPWALAQLKELSESTGFLKQAQERPYVTFLEKNPTTGQLRHFLVVLPNPAANQSQFISLSFQPLAASNQQRATMYIDQIITAQASHWSDAQQSWVLQNGWLSELRSDGIYQTSRPFKTTTVSTSVIAAKLLSFPYTKAQEMNLANLSRYIELLRQGSQTDDMRFFKVKWAQRFTLPWVILLFTVMGCAIGIERSRARKNLGLTYTALLLLVYNVVITTTTTMGNMGALPVWISAMVPIGFALLGGWGVAELRKLEG